MGRHHQYGHPELFLVSMFSGSRAGSDGEAACEGKVQRVVDGEAYLLYTYSAPDLPDNRGVIERHLGSSAPVKGVSGEGTP
jgi:hypothetical protein